MSQCQPLLEVTTHSTRVQYPATSLLRLYVIVRTYCLYFAFPIKKKPIRINRMGFFFTKKGIHAPLSTIPLLTHSCDTTSNIDQNFQINQDTDNLSLENGLSLSTTPGYYRKCEIFKKTDDQ